MKFTDTDIKDVKVIETEPFQDERGFFDRLFCLKEFLSIGFDKEIVQINHSYTRFKGTFRGFHYQEPPYTETKIIKCISGSIFEMAIDIRRDSPTFLQWIGVEISSENKKMIFIPDGFAHGFQALDDHTELIYFHSQFYEPKYEHTINYKDPLLNIRLPLEISSISVKDRDKGFLTRDFKGVDLNIKEK